MSQDEFADTGTPGCLEVYRLLEPQTLVIHVPLFEKTFGENFELFEKNRAGK
ncbi:hypothetical protein [Variovorax guangxiensis]|uniref:hypothetical protein n=1 Tax=Variovorax guangxiensis TaxID=1775474 RepID=UPI0014051D80|nr:hypothetical protein [Variovorax guangxiensis]